MHPSDLFNEFKKRELASTDLEIARLIGLTRSRVSQMRAGTSNLSARQVATFLQKAEARGRSKAFSQPIWPIVEMYPIERITSRRDCQWELLPTGKTHSRNRSIREHLENEQGVYILYDSLGCAIYAGKTERQNIWKEMTNAFNRERSNHQAFLVAHPMNGSGFSPAWEIPRHPKKRVVYLYDTAHYFSAYAAEPELIPALEALLVRAFCNSLSNKKMERFKSD